MSNEKQNQSDFPLGKKNFIIMAIGFGLVVLGFMLMWGGKADSPEVFNPEIFNFRRITLAPITIILGFAVVMYSIFAKSE